MKPIISLFLAVILTFTLLFAVSAQSAETIWLSTGATNYKTGETLAVTVNAISVTRIQGLAFQIRYDPACLKPVGATSPISGMKGAPLTQTPGLVDATFDSATPQTANGTLAEVRFITLGECRTELTLESAALSIRNDAGVTAPLAGTTLGKKTIPVSISKELGSTQASAPAVDGTPVPILPAANEQGFPSWLIILFAALAGAIGVLVAINLLRKP